MRSVLVALACSLALASAPGCGGDRAHRVRLVSTTSTQNSGLLDWLLPAFTSETGVEVDVVAAGTGKALAFGRGGDADLLLVHARALEDRFLEQGHASERRDVMYNDFVIAGPPADPAHIRGMRDPAAALARLAAAGARFASRGDGSGTHVREMMLWKRAGVAPATDPAYREVGNGMARCLVYADEKQAYVLTDRGTFLALRSRRPLDIEILVEGAPNLRNPYGLLLVNPLRHPGGSPAGARRLMDWLTSKAGQARIGAYQVDGVALFHPNAAH